MHESIKLNQNINAYKNRWPCGQETSLSHRSTGFESPYTQTLKHVEPIGYCPIRPFLLFFRSNSVQLSLRLTVKNINLSQGQILAILAACFKLCKCLWPMLPILNYVKSHYITNFPELFYRERAR